MDVSKEGLRAVMLYEFRNSTPAVACFEKLKVAFGDQVGNRCTVNRWYARFKSGDTSLQDHDRSGRPPSVDPTPILDTIRRNPSQSTREVAATTSTSQTTVVRCLRKEGYSPKLPSWIPHTLSEKNLLDRCTAAASLLNREQADGFLSRLVTGDEKWIQYVNITRKRAWCKAGEHAGTIAKPPLHGRKVLLCCWWDCEGPIHYELLKQGQTVDADLYIEQLDRLSQSLRQKRPALVNRKGVVFHQDNARPHVAIRTMSKLRELGWEVLPHPPYSPDLAPSDFHLFRALDNHVSGRRFLNDEDVRMCLSDFFASQPVTFYRDGIMKLPGRWAQVLSSGGAYIKE